MNEITQIAFDYTQIEEVSQRERIQVAALDIKKRLQRAQGDLIMVGQRLIDVKEQLEHGLFQDWIEKEFPFSYRTAANMMAVAEKFGGKSATVALLNDSTLYMLAGASVPDQVIEQVVTEAQQTGKAPTKERVKQIITAAKPIKLQTAPAPDVDLPADLANTGRCRLVKGRKYYTITLMDARIPQKKHMGTFITPDECFEFARRVENEQAQPEPAPSAARPLTAGEVLAVIHRAAAHHAGDNRKAQGAWVALNFSPSNYAEALNGDNVYIPRDSFSEAYRAAQVAYGLVRSPITPIRMAEPAQPPTEPPSEPTTEPAPLTAHQQKQIALQAELEFWRQAAQRSALVGELTGNFSATLGLDREIQKVIALLKNNVID